jgi:tripartite-type tricarboxylate transporter receptor subunit TctC
MVLVVNPSFPAKSVKELIQLAKAKPGTINYASGGNGTGSHLATEQFKSMAGIDMMHIPYKGNGPATTALLGGEVSVMLLQMAVAGPHIAAGKLRALAVPGAERSAAMPELPTIAEAALPGFSVTPWFGVVAPAGTPKAAIAKLNSAIAAIMALPEVKEQLTKQGAQAVSSTPEEFAAFIKTEIPHWAKVVKTSGARVD